MYAYSLSLSLVLSPPNLLLWVYVERSFTQHGAGAPWSLPEEPLLVSWPPPTDYQMNSKSSRKMLGIWKIFKIIFIGKDNLILFLLTYLTQSRFVFCPSIEWSVETWRLQNCTSSKVSKHHSLIDLVHFSRSWRVLDNMVIDCSTCTGHWVIIWEGMHSSRSECIYHLSTHPLLSQVLVASSNIHWELTGYKCPDSVSLSLCLSLSLSLSLSVSLSLSLSLSLHIKI